MTTLAPSLDKKNNRLWWLLIALEIVICIFVLWDVGEYSPDDAYIYLNGARQLARGDWPNMTPGEAPTNSWASHLWLFMITPAFLLGINAVLWVKLLGLIFLAAVLFQISGIIRLLKPDIPKLQRWAMAGVALSFAALVYNAISGLETIFAVFTLLFLVRLIIRDTQRGSFNVSTGLAAGLHLLARPDTFIDIGVLGLFLLYLGFSKKQSHDWKQLWKPIVGLLPAVAIYIAIHASYGTLLASSAAAKTQYWASLFSSAPLLHLYGGIRSLFSDFASTPGNLLILLGFLAYVIGYKQSNQSEKSVPKIFFLSISAVVLAQLLKAVFINDWMRVHRLWLGVGIILLIGSILLIYRWISDERGRIATMVALCVGLASGLWGWRIHVREHFNEPNSPTEQMGELINELRLDDSWIVVTDMGVIPYFGDIPAIDNEQPPICNRYLLENPGDSDYIWSHQVDFVVFFSITMNPISDDKPLSRANQRAIFDLPYFQEHFRPAVTAEWRPSLLVHNETHTTGRYLHLWISDRIETPPYPPGEAWLRGHPGVDTKLIPGRVVTDY